MDGEEGGPPASSLPQSGTTSSRRRLGKRWEPEPYWGDISQDDFYIVRAKAEKERRDRSMEKIARMEAICKVCNRLLQPEKSVLEISCKCRPSLVHENCLPNHNQKCHVCGESVRFIPVTLSMPDGSSTSSKGPFGQK